LKAELAETNRQHRDKVERLENRIQALVRWESKKIQFSPTDFHLAIKDAPCFDIKCS
jgi:hypothetical protein